MCFMLYDLYIYLMKIYTSSEEETSRPSSCPPDFCFNTHPLKRIEDNDSSEEEWVAIYNKND